MPLNVQIKWFWVCSQQMVVKGSNGNSRPDELGHNRIEFRVREYQITHDYRGVPPGYTCQPTSKCDAGLIGTPSSTT